MTNMKTVDEYLEQGNLTVADIALIFPHSLKELSNRGLDFCCGGNRSYIEACHAVGIDPKAFLDDLVHSRSDARANSRVNFSIWEMPLLIDFIIQHHHAYVRQSIPEIEVLLEKVCEVHGSDSPFLISIREDFEGLRDELFEHLEKEEKIVFPAILAIFRIECGDTDQRMAQNYLKQPLRVVEDEHKRAGELIQSIRKHSDNYTPPSHACPTFGMTYTLLQEFDDDLMQHIHIENNILFARVKEVSEDHNSL
jgi:regulator of cell morphogenesis and NO signaling